ncbi:MAG: chemotaxis protein CheW [Syntrophobacteraceae bacterium]
MLILLFHLGNNRYAVKSERVREVSPMVNLQPLPHAPDCLAGLFHYRGLVIPVVDLGSLIHGRACQMRLSTRIIVVDYARGENFPPVVGLLAEKVIEAKRTSQDSFVSTGVHIDAVPFLSRVMMEGNDAIHLLDLELLPASLGFLEGVQDPAEETINI